MGLFKKSKTTITDRSKVTIADRPTPPHKTHQPPTPPESVSPPRPPAARVKKTIEIPPLNLPARVAVDPSCSEASFRMKKQTTEGVTKKAGPYGVCNQEALELSHRRYDDLLDYEHLGYRPRVKDVPRC
eukprot:GHVN01075429.1.p1 GENE.GHVN01075429.1~~GHVN01075429.1.p1  ORF type:complete len:129 (+),score=19.50 GHVN01075429.1:160-546(+)